jgi:hypothetical protein
MARLGAVALALVAFATTLAPLDAQQLQRLTVTQLVLSADTVEPKLEVPFHLIVTAHVRERVARFQNLDLPILAELEVLGDEHSVSVSASGTTYREVISVVAHHTGPTTIDPVTLDAIDARTGKPMRYSSNPLTVAVGGGALKPSFDFAALVWRFMRALFFALCAGALALVLVLLFRRRMVRGAGRAAVTLPPATPVAPPPARNPRDVLRDALTTLRAERTRATAMRVRHVARSMVGASDTETLDDALRRPLAADAGMRELLTTLERAAFTYESDLQTAVAGAIAALERLVA